MVHISSLCRICLTSDVNMHVIAQTPLQEVYEKLTNVPLHTEMRPIATCYICFARLKNTQKLIQTSLRAEKLLRGILESNQPTTTEFLNVIQSKNNLTIHIAPVECITVAEEQITNSEEVITAVEEGGPVKVEQETVTVKTERTAETSEPNGIPLSDLDNGGFTDSDDDVPLKNISMKQDRKGSLKRTDGKGRKYKTAFKLNAKEIILTKEEQLNEMNARASSSNYMDSPYKCVLCYKGFVDDQAYSNHREKHAESSGDHECDICHMRYRTARHLRTHSATSHFRQYLCNVCEHRSHTKNQAREHQKWHEGYTYECELCGQKFRKSTSYLTHMRKCHPTQHVCELCGESFVGKHGLLMHKSKTHRHTQQNPTIPQKNSDTYCSECQIQFLTSDAWKRHMLNSFKHKMKNKDGSHCAICGGGVPGPLAEHLRGHARALRPPRARAPPPAARLPCQQCNGTFSSKSLLITHTKRAHLGVKYNRNVVCEICGKHCTSNASLKYHQRSHTGEKPYSCAVCNKRFSSKNHLNIHTRTHTGDRPYVCATCGKRFTQKPALNRHQRIHTGVKPYECQFCSKCFSQSDSLNVHVKAVHLKMPIIRKKGGVKAEDRQDV
ncbi:zinc finger protein ZFP2 [Amyelois transitella]|uniref:zinc finger protein ZFP2 n=1 Tax=Amyelois transitella TaxID=680683 RepID=UPI002990634F|nr:zinc finger protein ZFP2 [Amyelois transitella]